jgi:hypothetical protein
MSGPEEAYVEAMNTEPLPASDERLAGFAEARELLGSELAEHAVAEALWTADGHPAEGPKSDELREEYARSADIVILALDELFGDNSQQD